MSLYAEIKAARAEVNKHEFGTNAWDLAMQEVRALTQRQMEEAEPEEYCSVDSGFHRTRTLDGRIV
jgi:hypothetical protein